MKPTILTREKESASTIMKSAFSKVSSLDRSQGFSNFWKFILAPIFPILLLSSCHQDPDIEPIKSTIKHNVLEEAFPVYGFHAYLLDLNQDEIQDFTINVMSVGFNMGVRHYFQINSHRDARVILSGDEITPLVPGTIIGPENTSEVSEWSIFTGSMMVRTVTENQPDQWSGPWAPNKDYFAGLSIRIDGEYHYGWVKLQADKESHAMFVQEYAFQSVPNQSIKAGQRQ